METFSIRDLRVRTGDLVRCAEAGELSVIAKHGQPIIVAVPLDESLLSNGVMASLAVKLFRDHVVSIGKAAKIAKMTKLAFIGLLGQHGIPAIDYPGSELDAEMALLNE